MSDSLANGMGAQLECHRSTPLLDAARAYARRGWSVIPVPHASKDPGRRGWQHLRLSERDLPYYFNGRPQNIGVLLGEPSGWLVDVDLDHPRAVELADQFLPPTPLVFGRTGKRRSHRLYCVSAPIRTKKFKSPSAGMIVELRSTGLQTVFPPSTHESGEAISWHSLEDEPATVDPDELLAAVRRLAEAVQRELGDEPAPQSNPQANGVGLAKKQAKRKFRAKCVEAMLRMNMSDHHDGSSRLFAAACRVVEHNLSDSEGLLAIRDYARQRPFPTVWTDEQILTRIRDAERTVTRGYIQCAESPGTSAKIVIDADEHRVVSETVSALQHDPEIYQRGGTLVRVLRDGQPADGVERCSGSAVITTLPQANLRERMTKYARFVKLIRQENTVLETPAHPTSWLVAAVDARGHWPQIRHLAAVSEFPILRPDGTLCQATGYDAQTAVLFDSFRPFPQLPVTLTHEDACQAVLQLLEVVCDFPFESDEHRSAWLAALLTPLARFAFTGPAPLFLVDANIRGAGKGLLMQTIGWIVLGREMPVSSYAHDSEEMRKKITAIALAGDQMVHLDNLEGRFGDDALDRALTATRWRDRLLGRSEQVDLPLNAIWYGTGNNVAVAADTARRIVHIRLDVLQERPEERAGFRHPDLIGWIRNRREELLTQALTILAAYCQAGQPSQGLTPFGSYEGWSRLVREAIVWAGLPDPCLTRTRLTATADVTADSLAQLIAAWRNFDSDDRGLVIADVLVQLYPRHHDAAPTDEASVAMRAALEVLVGSRHGHVPGAREVGNRLRHFRRRVVSGHYLDTTENRRNGAVWRIWRASSGV